MEEKLISSCKGEIDVEEKDAEKSGKLQMQVKWESLNLGTLIGILFSRSPWRLQQTLANIILSSMPKDKLIVNINGKLFERFKKLVALINAVKTRCEKRKRCTKVLFKDS